MKIFFKNLLSSIFPFQTQKLIMFIQSYFRRLSGNPNESELVYQILGKNSDCIMIDVGAHTGGSLRPFANNNWHIYAFEPDSKIEKNFNLASENSQIYLFILKLYQIDRKRCTLLH